ncbi:unnamed protein product [Hermetia illucens]|uniref:NADP-dependent oxidoreductase domain-containing protein n=1 Tax=Hermetia illucens TaxID=343691 RepID=A0A7R8UM92_HERIL|nr:aldo-keto reductase family 1 member B7-like [Hermetia illucens]CAD7083079.1 unnamed protein product [Hermetia illucens]
MVKIPTIKQNDNTVMPIIGLGTYTSTGGDCKRAVKDAIDAGYRHFDTAYFYENEAEVGEAIREKIAEGAIKREDVYIVTKLWCHFHDPERVEKACRLSLKNFGLDYIDMYLMHWPYAYVYEGDRVMFPTDPSGEVKLSDVDYVDTWKAMEKLVGLGLTKSIGVSNFNSKQLTRLLSAATIKPVHNQIEAHPGLSQKKLIEFCKNLNIVVTGYCPLGRPEGNRGDFLNDKKIIEIGKKYNKSSAQVILRWLVDSGVVPIPKSVTKSRIQANIDIFDFQLSAEDRQVLDGFNTGHRIIPMTHAKNSPHYPFHEEF